MSFWSAAHGDDQKDAFLQHMMQELDGLDAMSTWSKLEASQAAGSPSGTTFS